MRAHDEDRPCTADAGPYVLGALAPEQARAFQTHLADCPACRKAVDELGVLPALLDRVPPELVASLAREVPPDVGVRADPEPPPLLLSQLLMAVRRDERARRRRRMVVGSLAAAAVLLLGVLLPWRPTLPWGAEQPGDTFTLAAPDEGTVPVEAVVRLDARAWGTQVDVTCTYAALGGPGYGDAPAYALVVRGADGTEDEVSTWTAVTGEEVTVPGATTVPRDEIVEVQLRAADGSVVLRSATG